MRQHDFSKSGTPAMLVLDLVSQDPSQDFAWAHEGLGRLTFRDGKLCYRRNRAVYADGLRLTIRLRQGYEYEFRISVSKMSSGVNVKGSSWRFSIDGASVGQEFSARFVADAARTEIFFQTPNDWWGTFDISSASLFQLTLPQRDYFAGTLGRAGAHVLDRVDATPPDQAQAALAAILCPLTPRELPLMLANLKRWNDVCQPFIADEVPVARPELVLSFSSAPRQAIRRAIDDAFDQLDALKACFSGITVMFCDLSAEKDVYVRHPKGPGPKYGFKAGPNWLFYESISRLKSRGGMVFLMECDCRPIAPGWLGRLTAVAGTHADAWVVGGIYSGVSGMDPKIHRHINGNALYNIGDRRFQIFLEEFWDWMQHYIQEVDSNLAYDCAWEVFVHSVHSQKYEFDYANVVKRVASKFRAVDFIVNIAGQAEHDGRYLLAECELSERFPGASFVHGPVADSKNHCRGSLSVGKQLSAPADGASVPRARRGGPIFDRSFWLTNDTFRANDQIEMVLRAGGSFHDDWKFRLIQLNGVDIQLEAIDSRHENDETEVRLLASVPIEMNVLIFKIESEAGELRCPPTSIGVKVERSQRVVCDFTSVA